MKLPKFMCLLAIVMMFAGCATAPQWQHTVIRDEEAVTRQLVIDEGQCLLTASGAVPQVAITPPSSNAGNQTYNFTGSSYTTTGQRNTYNGYVVPASGGFLGGLASGLTNGAAMGTAIAARQERDKILRACLYGKGWTDSAH